MLTTEREETTLYDGREWRTHYWILKKNIILKYAHEDDPRPRTLLADKRQPIQDISDEAIYDSLDEGQWGITRKIQE